MDLDLDPDPAGTEISNDAVLDQSFFSCVSSLTKAAFFYGITIIVWVTILRPGLQVGP